MITKLVQLGEICDVKRGTTITEKQTIPGEIPVIAGGLTYSYTHNISNRTGEVITVSGSGANAGFVNLWRQPIFASDCSTIQPKNNDVDISFVYHFLKSKQYFINSTLRSGAAQPHVYAKDLAKIKIPIPPLTQQQHIAAILDKAVEIINKREQAITKLDELVSSAFAEYCLKSKNQRITKIKDLVVKRELTETNDANVWSLSLEQIESNSGEVLSKVFVSKAKLGNSTYYFEPDVVLYSKLRPYLNKVVIPDTSGYATTELVPLYCDKEQILPSFMGAYLRSARFVDFANTNSGGAKMPRVIMDKFWDYEMKLPDLKVQNDFQKLNEKCIAIKMQLKHSIKKHDELIHSLREQAFATGFN